MANLVVVTISLLSKSFIYLFIYFKLIKNKGLDLLF